MFTWGNYVIELESVQIGRLHEHGSAGGFESTHSGDRIQKVADSVTQSLCSCEREADLTIFHSAFRQSRLHGNRP